MSWHIYIARCADGSFYTGIARDPAKRLAVHNAGLGARYTRAHRPVALVWTEPAADQATALKREYAIKQWSRERKERLVMGAATAAGRGPRPTGARKSAAGRGTVVPDGFGGFRPGLFRFFSQLRKRNTRAWFDQQRPVYELEVRTPLKALIEEMDVRLAAFAPEIVGDPRRSAFRIHRDVRFSRDKAPYKTHAACWFYHADAGRGIGGDAEGGAGFYLHLEPGQCLIGAGIWMPPRASLTRIREALVAELPAFAQIVEARAFRRRFGSLEPEAMLTRMPRGYAADHPAARWLRYQSFTVGRPLTQAEALSPRLPATLARDFTALTPFVRWLNTVLGFRTLDRRL
ncbi:MAG: TIGR02453 family protein [Gemmatimonadota bacterium]|nr:TIGR02453 family protein [Gemmatimonadota bacterium]